MREIETFSAQELVHESLRGANGLRPSDLISTALRRTVEDYARSEQFSTGVHRRRAQEINTENSD